MIHFTKMQGIGNDYVYVNYFQEKLSDPAAFSRKISDRHFGIGSDGLILIAPSDCADFQMIMYNADGSRGEMCGNGIRCVGKYVYDRCLTKKTRITVETLAGVKELTLFPEDGKVKLVRVNMGSPIFEASKVPFLGSGECIHQPLLVEGKSYTINAVSMGNPHCVVFLEEDVRELDLNRIGPSFENHPFFPKRVNTEFVNVLDRNTLRMRVWERGSGETWACGTGACASAVAAIRNGLTEDKVKLQLLGGDLEIFWDRESQNVYMTGPAEIVFDGEIEEG